MKSDIRIDKVYEVLVDLFGKENNPEKYFNAGIIYRHGKREVWKEEDIIPSNRNETEAFLEILVDRGLAKRVICNMGSRHMDNIKFYQPKDSRQFSNPQTLIRST